MAAEPEGRNHLLRIAGTTEIPLRLPDGNEPLCGEDEILEYLERFVIGRMPRTHRAKSRDEVKFFAA